MLIVRFILLFGGPCRKGLHTLIFKNTLFFSHIAAAAFSHCVFNISVQLQSETSHLCSTFGESCILLRMVKPIRGRVG